MENEKIVFDQEDVSKNKTNAVLMAVFPILFFLPLVSDGMKSSAFLKFIANQSLICLICSAASGIAGAILGLIPILGAILAGLLSLAVFVLYILNIVNAAQANGNKLPFVGDISIIK